MALSYALLVTAAGSSLRFSSALAGAEKVKKEFLKLDEHTVLYHAARPFYDVPGLTRVVVTYAEGHEKETRRALEELAAGKDIPLDLLPGGATRQESVHRGLEFLAAFGDFGYVAIQDGARPYVKPSLIRRILETAGEGTGALPGLPVTDSLRRADGNGLLRECVSRENLFRVQTPQVFPFLQILKAHRDFASAAATDDAELYLRAGYPVRVVPGDEENRKVTYPEDIPDARRKVKEYLMELEGTR